MSEFSQLEEKIGYTFKDKSYLRGAMTHSSYSGGKNNGSNERLEFLGDSVLQITVSLYLYTNMTTVPEGGLTKLRASIVCENSLYNFAKRISLGDYILLGKGEEMTGGRERRSILADAFEALIAAIFLDGGMDEAQKFIMRFVPSIEAIKSGKVKLGDYKTILQEIIQQNPEEHISYEVTEEEGEAHHKTFTADVMLNGQSIGTGSGQSKKEAEQAAAKEAIDKLTETCRKMVDVKLNDSLLSLFVLAIFCGMLMFIAVDTYKHHYEKKDTMVTVVAILGVVVFILAGFEHCIADMFYFTLAGAFPKAFPALIVMTLGNAVGGNLIPLGQNIMKKLND